MDKVRQKIEEGWIHCVFIIEMLGKPKEHLEKNKLIIEGYLLYYSCFNLMHALLLTKEDKIKNYPTSHGGVKALFFRLFSEFRDYSKLIEKTYNLRHEMDYKLKLDVKKEDIEKLLESVREFYLRTLEYLKKKDVLSEKEIEELKL